jgi:hypothetical protein
MTSQSCASFGPLGKNSQPLRPLPSTGITRLRQYYEPLRHPRAPGLCRHRPPVGRPRPRQGASRVARAFLVYVLSPLPRRSHWRYCFAHPTSDISLPRKGHRVGLRIDIFEACSAFTHVTARTLALPPIRGTLPEGFSHFVTSMTAPVASGWSGCRVGFAPTGKRRLCTAHTHCSPPLCRTARRKAVSHLAGIG